MCAISTNSCPSSCGPPALLPLFFHPSSPLQPLLSPPPLRIPNPPLTNPSTTFSPFHRWFQRWKGSLRQFGSSCAGPEPKDPNGPRAPKRPGPRAGPSPGESLLVCWARAQGSVGRAPYIGVDNPDTHVVGHRPVASLRPTV